MKQTIQAIYAACGKAYPTDNATLYAINFLSELIDENHSLDEPELFDAIETLTDKLESDDDFYFEYDGNEYRIIAENAIWDIYVEEIKNTVEDCYSDVLKLDDIPSFIEFSIDWEQTAKNAYVDGYGYTFSSYDGSELEIANHYVFRTN